MDSIWYMARLILAPQFHPESGPDIANYTQMQRNYFFLRENSATAANPLPNRTSVPGSGTHAT